jgi:hypothetical protein
MNKIFNEVRIAHQGQILSTSEITTLLTKMPKSNDCLFLTTLVKFGCLTREGKGKYKFTSNPIHISLLNRVMDEIVCKHREYSKKHYNKSAKVVEEKSDVQKAIDLLLSTGEYEIYKIEKVVNVKKTQVI